MDRGPSPALVASVRSRYVLCRPCDAGIDSGAMGYEFECLGWPDGPNLAWPRSDVRRWSVYKCVLAKPSGFRLHYCEPRCNSGRFSYLCFVRRDGSTIKRDIFYPCDFGSGNAYLGHRATLG